MVTKEQLAALIAETLNSVNKTSVADRGDFLEVRSSTGTTQIPIRTSKTTSRSTTTFR